MTVTRVPYAMNILLLSGGIESSTLLYEYGQRAKLRALFIDYGQSAAGPERHAASALCAEVGIGLKIVNLRRVAQALAGNNFLKAHVPLPARNLLAVSVAANWALQNRAQGVYVGLQRGDQTHPEGRPDFVRGLTESLTALGLELQTPYYDLSKAQVVARGQALGMDYNQTRSCLLGHRKPCLRCSQCAARLQVLGQENQT